eukprot:maker-scaffold95_size379157-snap-gene-0.17 protein:Tk00587 transcript:maker-scaffold95_size379157-snap-gene-0.17-mRNA-1 annotation:"j domain-containing protein"
MNVDGILNYKRDSKEDLYNLLGCDRSSTQEQIITEFKTRAKKCHPDKVVPNIQGEVVDVEKLSGKTEEFQLLHQAKSILTNPEERRRYDKWLDSGLAMSYKQWRGLKDSVHTSMHWATPNTAGRMLESVSKDTVEPVDDEEIDFDAKDRSSITEGEDEETANELDQVPDMERAKSSKMTTKGKLKRTLTKATSVDGEPDDEVYYSPTDVCALGIKVNKPPQTWGWDDPGWFERNLKNALPKPGVGQDQENVAPQDGARPKNANDPALEDRRKKFADARQDSTMSSVVIMGKVSDAEMRRKFRNFEI